jgi:hypothetical protein
MDSTSWAAVAGGVAAVASIVALFFTYSQLKQARHELQDRRLDEEVKGVIGENILIITGLIEQVKAAVGDAEQGAAAVESIQGKVEEVLRQVEEAGIESQLQSDRADGARKKLVDSLGEAQLVLDRLNQVAQKADQDAIAISEVRQAAQQGSKIQQQIESYLTRVGYRILNPPITQSGAGTIDVFAVPVETPWSTRPVAIEIAGAFHDNGNLSTPRGRPWFRSKVRNLNEAEGYLKHFVKNNLNLDQVPTLPQESALKIIIVTRDFPADENEDIDGVHIVHVDSFQSFFERKSRM